MRALAIGYFFVVVALAGFAVRMGYRLLVQFRQAWLLPYTAYLASWGALVLLSVVQYLLIGHFLPQAVHEDIFAATRPLFAVALGVALYFLSAFMAELTGRRPSRTYTAVYLSVWAAMAVAVSAGSDVVGDAAWAAPAASIAAFLLKTGTIYGWIAYALLRTRGMTDQLELGAAVADVPAGAWSARPAAPYPKGGMRAIPHFLVIARRETTASTPLERSLRCASVRVPPPCC